MKKFSSASFRKLLYKRNITIPFSIIVAFVMWLTISLNQQTSMDRTFTVNRVNINLEGTAVAENGMSIINDITKQNFIVRVRGTSNAVSRLTKNDISLYASAAEVDSPGEKTLTVHATQNTNGGYEIIEISPSTITVNFDYVDTEQFPIMAQTDGITVTESGLVKGTEVIGGLETSVINITGPRTIISKIDRVVAAVKDTKQIIKSETFDAEIVLYDAQGTVIPKESLSLSATAIKVTVPVYKQKTVPVKVTFTNLPEGFSVDSLDFSVDHPSIVIEGVPEAVELIEEISLNAIDITKLSLSSKTFEVTAKLPEGIRIFDAIDKFVVTFDLSGYSEKSLTVNTVKNSGLSSGLSATASMSVRNVKICAPKSVINKINASNTYAKAVLTDKKAGEYIVVVNICFDDHTNAWAIGTYKTTVTIK